MSQKIICNVRCLYQSKTGVQRYTEELVNSPELNVDTIAPNKPLTGFSGHLWEQAVLPTKIKNKTLWSPANIGPVYHENQILALHDISPIDHPEWFSKKFSFWYNFIWPKLIPRVRAILTLSEFSKSRIIENFPAARDKIHVVPLAASKIFENAETYKVEEIRKRIRITDEAVFVVVGSLDPRKNLPNVIKAWEIVSRKKKNKAKLVIIGNKNDNIFHKELLNQSVPNVIFTGHLSDSDLIALYQIATATLFLSLYEGFGLPIIESMKIGTPVITSNIGAMYEYSKDVALHCDPYSPNQIADKILMLLGDERLANNLSKIGKVHAEQFSWRATAMLTKQIFEKYAS